MKKYITIQGDTWDMISYKVFGSEMHMDKLIKANNRYMHIYEFSAGVVLDIPEIENETVSDSAVPWR